MKQAFASSCPAFAHNLIPERLLARASQVVAPPAAMPLRFSIRFLFLERAAPARCPSLPALPPVGPGAGCARVFPPCASGSQLRNRFGWFHDRGGAGGALPRLRGPTRGSASSMRGCGAGAPPFVINESPGWERGVWPVREGAAPVAGNYAPRGGARHQLAVPSDLRRHPSDDQARKAVRTNPRFSGQ